MTKQSDQLLEQGPPISATAGVTPIGVPSNYVAPGTLDPADAAYVARGGAGPVRGTPPRGPTYYEGDDWLPASLPAEKLAELQQQMANSGALTSSYRLGVWDDASRGAYRDLLAAANAGGTDVATAMQRYAQSKKVASDETKKHFPLRPLDPASINQTVKQTAKQVLGRDLQQGELDFLTSQMTKFAQEQAIAQQQGEIAASEGTSPQVAQVDAESRFRELLDQRYKPELDMTKLQGENATNQDALGKSLLSLASRIGGTSG